MFDEFLTAFFGIFQKSFKKQSDFLSYLNLPNSKRTGDEASIVDNAIISPLLELLGFAPGEQGYNQQKQSSRPDFAPSDRVYGTCFIVENKNTSLTLTLDLNDPDSHLSQLRSYIRGLRFGWLTNGIQFMVWDFSNPNQPRPIVDLDLPTAIQEWNQGGAATLSNGTTRELRDIFDMFRKAAFTSLDRLKDELALDLNEWQQQALPLGNGSGNEPILVESLQSLLEELKADARRSLNHHLTLHNEYLNKANRLTDDAIESATQQIQQLRERVLSSLAGIQNLVNLSAEDHGTIQEILIRLEKDARAFISPKELFDQILEVLNQAFQRKHANQAKPPKTPSSLEKDYTPLHDALNPYVNMVFGWHQRQATLRQTYQTNIRVFDDYTVWTALVQETMLGGLNEEQRRDEFALQAAYVVFIRLLLIRVCEDKEIFQGEDRVAHRFVSDGGMKQWQETIKRYWIFATGNPYSPLLDMAYNNAQNIYAHFFTGRELFNWYQLNEQQLIMTLHQLSRFNFAEVDSDIVGTVYNTYVSRKEKKEKGQYYTPPEIVNYILDEVGYVSGTGIIGKNKRLIDPACGSGSFLVAATKRLVSAYKNNADQIDDPVTVLERVQANLFGFDLNPFACYLAEVNLLIQVLDLVKLAHEKQQHPKIQRFHIYNVDALARPSGSYRFALFNTLIAEESDQVDQIKSRSPNTPYTNGFAFVVANPPYGASLSDDYKNILRADYADVFYGQPDTYVFFFKLGIELLAKNGKLGFITPNTYLTGKNTTSLRSELLNAGRIEQIVDLPQGIWSDATVDCLLLFLSQEDNEAHRKAQKVKVNLLDFKDTLDKLTTRTWYETLEPSQESWLDNSRFEFKLRYNSLIQQVEEACRVSVNGSTTLTKVLRLEDVTESNQGIIVYETKASSTKNMYVKPRKDLPLNEDDWKPLLDGSGFVGRYELRWGKTQPYLKYGDWLCRKREEKYFDSPKIILVRLRNKSLKRRLVATFDDTGFYNRDNYNNVITAENSRYDLKFILALFNSSLLNYWYSRTYLNVNINPDTIRQLPIYPADGSIQAEFVELVDRILAKNAQLNQLREQGYIIKRQRNGNTLIEIPYDRLLSEIQQQNPNFSTLNFFDARASQLFSIPESCKLEEETISSNVFISPKYPNNVVLRNNKLWFEVPDDSIRRYLLGYLKTPQWQGKTWDAIKNQAQIPEEVTDLNAFFALENQKRQTIETLLNEVVQIDAEIDEKVLNLYGINDPTDRQRVLGSAPTTDEDAETTDDETETTDIGEIDSESESE
ncbi:N-6 DNA methylase [Sphaerospermopsis sp. FACHB-1094]|uniref:N-6 DNA methylase n=1 Tax=Sphaerospermopsis sp. FACHB-1094 TaxID=2692861 RepID=UPI001688AB2D|nr:N-6 DNA methylase [Sphaerospermopsis sp. FACHB-1094]MBD2131548.1 N-6 DNA methylase [Sphaerospermopsis sp. FACHB-1094]